MVDKGTKVNFIKCYCPFDVLTHYAEELSFKAPLEVFNIDDTIYYYYTILRYVYVYGGSKNACDSYPSK